MIRWLLVLFWLPAMGWAQDWSQIERQLSVIGIDPGPLNAQNDIQTYNAVMQYQYAYGFDATGQLSADALNLLDELARFAAVQHPFKVTHKRDWEQKPEQLFQGGLDSLPPQKTYANGLHFLAQYRPIRNSTKNLSLAENVVVPLKQRIEARRAHLWKAARDLALSRNDVFGASVIVLTRYEFNMDDNGTGTIADTLPALQTMLTLAEAAPKNVDYLDALIKGVAARISHRSLCKRPEGKVFFPLLERAVRIAVQSGVDPLNWMAITRATLQCAPDDKRDAYYQYILGIASRISEASVIATQLAWAHDAKRRRSDDLAREQFRVAAAWYMQGKAWRELNYVDVSNGLMPATDVLALHELGLVPEAEALGAQRVKHITSVPPSSVGESSAEQSNYSGALTESALLFIETGQFEHLRELGQFMVRQELFIGYGFNRSNNPTGDVNAWDVALTGLHSVFRAEGFQRTHDLGAKVLPRLLAEGALHQALEVSLIQAESAKELGAFEDAESALVRSVSLANQAGALDKVQDRIKAVRQALNLALIQELSPDQKVIGQLDAHYTQFCGPNVTDQEGYYQYPDIDFEALGDDHSVARALLQANMMNRILTCGITRKMTRGEARLICALAGFSGRQDVVNYLINAPFPGVEDWERRGVIEVCAHGLADSGHFEWFDVKNVPSGNAFTERNIRFLAKSPAERARIVASSTTADFSERWSWDDVEIRHLEMPLPNAEREKLIKEFQRKFESAFGRIGPQESDYTQATNEATAYRRMGLFRAAEAHLYIGARVDPFRFGAESEEVLNAQLLLPYAVHNRLGYAKLYRAWGKPDKAYAAIGRLTEQAIELLASNTNPPPGTVEQWAKRLEALFVAYLELQFEDLTQGPNYPAIFAIQQYLQLADSTASASVLEQRLNSANPLVAREYQDAQRALRAAMRDPEGQGDVLPELSLRLQAIEAQLPETDAALKSHQIGVMRPLRDVMLALRADESTMLVITQLPDAVVLMVLDGKNARVRKLDLSEAELQNTITAFRRSIIESKADYDIFNLTLARSLYSDLIGWAHVNQLPPKELRLVSSGPLSSLPFAALRHQDGWLGGSTSLRASPSVARGSQTLRQSSDLRGFIGLGDPNLTRGDVAGRNALLGAGTFLSELPETAAELAYMAIVFGGNPKEDVFTRDRATEKQMQLLNAENRLGQVAVLALATHGLLSRETGTLKSAGLVLSLPQNSTEDGILTANEIYSYRIGADIVLLSACNTGTPDADKGLSELASAFLYAGAGALLLTHWEIDSGAAVELTKRIAIEHRTSQTDDYGSALQGAIEKMLADETYEKFHHPRFWASHFVLG